MRNRIGWNSKWLRRCRCFARIATILLVSILGGCSEYEFLLEEGDMAIHRFRFGSEEGVFEHPIEDRVFAGSVLERALYLTQFPLVILRFAETIEAGSAQSLFERNRIFEDAERAQRGASDRKRLQELLHSDDPVRRRTGLGLLGTEEVEMHLERVIELVEDPDPDVRLTAVQTLRFHPHVRASSALGRTLRADQVVLRVAALEALERIDHPEAVAFLVETLDDSAKIVRIRAIEALGVTSRSGRALAVPPLLDRLASEDPAVREGAVRALRRISADRFDYDALDELSVRREAIERWRVWWREEQQE